MLLKYSLADASGCLPIPSFYALLALCFYYYVFVYAIFLNVPIKIIIIIIIINILYEYVQTTDHNDVYSL